MGVYVSQGNQPDGIYSLVVDIVRVLMLLHRFADKPVIPALQELDKICFGIFISVDKDFAVLIDQNVNTISFTGTVWFDEQLAPYVCCQSW